MEKIYDIIYSILMAYGGFGIVLGAIILVLFIVQISLHLGIYGRIASFRLMSRKQIRDKEPAISVVVPLFAEDNQYLDTTLTSLLTQDYANFEVVVVYVGNSDDFFADLQSLQRLYPHLSPVHIDYSPHYPVSTKIALNIGYKSAKNDFIITTSSDATPASERWLSLLAKGFMYGDIVLGYSGIEHLGGFRNFIFREYQFNDSVAWLAAAIRRRTYSASRSALGFKKSLYFDARGFDHLNMNVGENDLFVQQIATRDNVSVVLSPRAVCTERTWGGWGWWWRRLKLLQTTHRFYPKSALLPTIAELVIRVLFFAAVVVALVCMPWEFKVAALAVALLRYFAVIFVVIRNAGRLGESGVAAMHFIYDIIEPFLRFSLALLSYKKYKKSWL
ncbi:MAG: glycosyltransferase [Rikenellaceae bacterium]|nr:glycosyltransferase [Rikenellaceae bacterium]